MMWTYACAVFVLLFAVGALSEDKSVTVGDITTKVKGQSGKILIYKGMNESDGVTVTYDAIEEIDTDESKIQSHSYNNFAQLTFTFSAPENDTYPNSNVSVTQFTFQTSVTVEGGPATLKSYVYIFTSSGNITVDGNDIEVKEGDMKFNAEIENWPFCDTCRHGNKDLTGMYLDFSVEIKGKKEPNKTDNETGAFDLGDGATVITPKQVIYFNGSTNTTEDMPAGYPKLITKGSKQIFIFRFKKFSDRVLYDPMVSLGTGNDTDTDGGDTDGGSTEEEKDVAAAGIRARVLGQSGKITIENEGAKGDDANRITVEFRNLAEKKSDNGMIKESGHSINSFASQAFKFSALTEQTYPDTSIAVSRISFHATLKNGATLTIYLYVFKDGGNITQDGESIIVEKGNVKFNIEINTWTFCNGMNGAPACQQGDVGEFLDFDVIIKGKGESKQAAGMDRKYDLGSGSVIVSKKVKVDGTIRDMADRYPMELTEGSKQIFRFRFPKFNSSVLYDPVITLTADSINSATKLTISSLILAAICYLFHIL